MPIDAIANQAQALEGVTNTGSSQATGERVQQKALGQDDFFKLLTTQLASQDPLKPMEDTAFIAQMANFSQLEMTSNLTKSFEKFTNLQQFSAAHGYIGKTVSLSTGEEGLVTSVERQDGETLVFLDGSNSNGRDINTIYKVGQGGASGKEGASASEGNALKNTVDDLAQTVKQIASGLADPTRQKTVDAIASQAASDLASGTVAGPVPSTGG